MIPLAELLDFEAELQREPGPRASRIRVRFGIPESLYHSQLLEQIDSPEADRLAPVLVARIRRARDSRRDLREAWAVHPDPAPALRGQTSLDFGRRNPAMEQLTLAEAHKVLGMARADEAADPDWKSRVDAAIEQLAATGAHFTAEDIRRIAGDPPDHPNAMGARFNAAARHGLIRKVAYRLSTRATLHRHPIAVWQGGVEP